jgi:hypothetical protein
MTFGILGAIIGLRVHATLLIHGLPHPRNSTVWRFWTRIRVTRQGVIGIAQQFRANWAAPVVVGGGLLPSSATRC